MKNIYRPFKGEPAEIRAIEEAWRADVIERGTLLAAVDTQRGPAEWRAWARFWLLANGSLLVLSGIIFFFAYNWAGMHRFEKFALIQAAIVIAVLLAWKQGWRTRSGQAFLVAATVFVGIFLAVFGQVYQTGADAWQLFFSWAVLVFAWVVIASSSAHWFLWLLIAETAIATCVSQSLSYDNQNYLYWLTLAGLLPAALLALRDGLLLNGREWLPEAWFRPTFLFSTLFALSVVAVVALFGSRVSIAWFLPWLTVAGVALTVYRRHLKDVLCLTLVAFDIAVVAIFAIGNIVSGNPLPIAITILAVVGITYRWLRSSARLMQQESNNSPDKERAHASI